MMVVISHQSFEMISVETWKIDPGKQVLNLQTLFTKCEYEETGILSRWMPNGELGIQIPSV